MPQFATLTLNDGQAAPAAHSFVAGGPNGTLATWFDKAAGIVTGYIRKTFQVREASSATAANSVTLGYELPTLGTVDGVQKRVRVSKAELKINFAQDATLQERKDLVAYVTNDLSNATVKQAIIDVENFY